MNGEEFVKLALKLGFADVFVQAVSGKSGLISGCIFSVCVCPGAKRVKLLENYGMDAGI